MAMTDRSPVSIELTVSWRWWWPLYLAGVIAFCRLTGQLPDPRKVAYWAGRAIRVRARKVQMATNPNTDTLYDETKAD